MDAAGIAKAAVVQASTAYGHANSYLAEVVAHYPNRFTGVFSTDILAEGAIARKDAENLRHSASCLQLLGRLLFPDLSLHVFSEIIDGFLRDMIWKPSFYV